MGRRDSSKSVWGHLAQTRHVWTQFAMVFANFFLIIVVIYFVLPPNPLPMPVEDRYLLAGKPEPWPEPPDPRAIACCYELSFGEWEPKIDLGEEIYYITVPSRIKLTTQLLEERWEEGGYVMCPASGTKASVHKMAYWRVTPSRTILLSWTTGAAGIEADLGPLKSGDRRGYATTFWDFPRQKQVAGITAKRINCGGSRSDDTSGHKKKYAGRTGFNEDE